MALWTPDPTALRMPSDEELLASEAMRLADLARSNVCDFFPFVIRHEFTQRALALAAHQRLIFEFVMAHRKSVIKIPIYHTKTYSLAALLLWLLGNDPTMRGAIISGTESQAKKPLRMVRDYIETSAALKLVFPGLRPSRREGDPWTSTALTIDRPYGIRDPSVVAFGQDSSTVQGSRLKWMLFDDYAIDKNSDTPEKRQKSIDFASNVLTRLDVEGDTRVVVTNTPWYEGDFVWYAEQPAPNGLGWPTLDMRVDGTIRIQNTDWDTPLIRPEVPGSYVCRLTENDPDPHNEKTLWPAVWPAEKLEQERRERFPIATVYNRSFMNTVFDDETALCKTAYIEACKQTARKLKIHSLAKSWERGRVTFMGVDLAFGRNEKNDETAIVVFCVGDGGERIILDIDGGRWSTDETVERILRKADLFGSVVTVENVSAQKLMLDWLRKANKHLPLYGHTTTAAKADPSYGVPGIFAEMSTGSWAIPNIDGWMENQTRKLVDECLQYAPGKHTGDRLMALYFAWNRAQKLGAIKLRPNANGQVPGQNPNGLANLRMR